MFETLKKIDRAVAHKQLNISTTALTLLRGACGVLGSFLDMYLSPEYQELSREMADMGIIGGNIEMLMMSSRFREYMKEFYHIGRRHGEEWCERLIRHSEMEEKINIEEVWTEVREGLDSYGIKIPQA